MNMTNKTQKPLSNHYNNKYVDFLDDIIDFTSSFFVLK